MTGSDPLPELQKFIDKRWATAQPRFYLDVPEGPRVDPEVTPAEAQYFLASVASDASELPLFEVDDDRNVRSERLSRRRDGAPSDLHFFEAPGRLRLETIIHMAAMARLRDEFGWPREHLIFESPAVVDENGKRILDGGELDVLLLEEPCAELTPTMTIAATRSRVGIEAKAHKKLLDKLLREMRACHAGSHTQHNKCRAIEVLRPRFFLGVAAADTWRLFSVVERDGRAVLGSELPDLNGLYFPQ